MQLPHLEPSGTLLDPLPHILATGGMREFGEHSGRDQNLYNICRMRSAWPTAMRYRSGEVLETITSAGSAQRTFLRRPLRVVVRLDRNCRDPHAVRGNLRSRPDLTREAGRPAAVSALPGDNRQRLSFQGRAETDRRLARRAPGRCRRGARA